MKQEIKKRGQQRLIYEKRKCNPGPKLSSSNKPGSLRKTHKTEYERPEVFPVAPEVKRDYNFPQVKK